MAVKTMKMTRTIRDQQYEETKDMLPEERLVYFQKKAGEFRNRLGDEKNYYRK